jgi:hypothetical protein
LKDYEYGSPAIVTQCSYWEARGTAVLLIAETGFSCVGMAPRQNELAVNSVHAALVLA